MEEERRLFYVAVTRAEQQLYLSAAEQRMLYGKNQYRALSPLLCEVDPRFYQNCSNRPAAAQKQDLSACKIVSHATLQQMRQPQVYRPKAAKPKRPAPQRPSDPFTVGAREEHLEYGLGYVVQRKHSGAITTLMIQLDDGRLVRLQLEFARAKLEFLGTGL